jgi:hypothetical protein
MPVMDPRNYAARRVESILSQINSILPNALTLCEPLEIARMPSVETSADFRSLVCWRLGNSGARHH